MDEAVKLGLAFFLGGVGVEVFRVGLYFVQNLFDLTNNRYRLVNQDQLTYLHQQVNNLQQKVDGDKAPEQGIPVIPGV